MYDSANTRAVMTATQFLLSGERLKSPSGEFELVMQESDGNLVLYGDYGTTPIWASQGGIGGTPTYHYTSTQGAHVVLQRSGSLIIYRVPQESSQTALWASPVGQFFPDLSDPQRQDSNPDAIAVLGDDGNFTVYSDSTYLTPLWSTNSAFAPWRAAEQTADWWQSYTKSYGYIPNAFRFPASLGDLLTAVQLSKYVKVVGAGWSSSDVSLPNLSNMDGLVDGLSGVDAASLTRSPTPMSNYFLKGLPSGEILDLDLNPLVLSQITSYASVYDPARLTVLDRTKLVQADIIYGEPSNVDIPIQVPAPPRVDRPPNVVEVPGSSGDAQRATRRLQSNLYVPDPSTLPWISSVIDIRQLASSLQSNLPNIAASATIAAGFIPGAGPNAPRPPPAPPAPHEAKANFNVPGVTSLAGGVVQPAISASDASARGFVPITTANSSQESKLSPVIPGMATPHSGALQATTVTASSALVPTIQGPTDATAPEPKLPFRPKAPPFKQWGGPPSSGGSAATTQKFYFHVEAGITITDLHTLLDRQSPRLAILGDSGNSEGTLAGVLSTASHGAEFAWPLLTDTVKAIHLVGPGGKEWWIEGKDPVADPTKLLELYQGLSADRIIAGSWSSKIGPQSNDTVTAQDVLNAVVVSLGAIGAIYSVVLEVVPQYGIEETVVKSTWGQILGQVSANADKAAHKAHTAWQGVYAGLRNWDAGANQDVLDFILDGALNKTQIAKGDNVYAELDINPLTFDAWIINKRTTQTVPMTTSPSQSISQVISAAMNALGAATINSDSVLGNAWAGSLFDYFGLSKDLENLCNAQGDCQDIAWFAPMVNFVNSFPDSAGALLAIFAAQAKAGLQPHVLPTILQVALDYSRGTIGGSRRVTSTSVSHTGGSFWPGSGIAGTVIEIALPADKAFSFIQTQLVDGILRDVGVPFLGFLSARICGQTQTLMGMQQWPGYTVMIELGAFRSPGAAGIVRDVLDRVNAMNAGDYTTASSPPPFPRLGAMLHWGFLNDNYDLNATPLANKLSLFGPVPGGYSLAAPSTHIERFNSIRALIAGNNTVGLFDNNFTRRLLDATGGQ